MENTDGLFRRLLEILRPRITATIANGDSNLSESIENIFCEISSPFNGVHTHNLLQAYVKKEFNYASFARKLLGEKLVSKKQKNGKMKICEKDEEFIYIPILESIEQLLSNKRLTEMIFMTKRRQENGIHYDVYDGTILKEDQYCQEKQNNSLQIVLYHDGVEVCNPLNSHAGVRKIDMFYYNLDIDPIFRSKHCAVRLLAIANAKLVRKFSIESILAPIVDYINKLYSGDPMKKGDQLCLERSFIA